MAERLAGIEGVDDLLVQHQTLIPQIEIDFKPDAAAVFGLTPGDLRRVTETLLTGTKVGELYEEQKVFDVVVRGTPEVGANIDALERHSDQHARRRRRPAARRGRRLHRADAQSGHARSGLAANRRDAKSRGRSLEAVAA